MAGEGTQQRRLAVVAGAVALVPVLALVVTRAGRDYLPIADFSVIDLRLRDVWTSDLPLVGPYSRYGWNHPGPAMFWLLAPLSGVTGRAPWATQVGAALLQGAAIVLVARVAWRRGGLALTVGVLAAVTLAATEAGARLLLEPWNPHVALPCFALLVLLAWALVAGSAWSLLGGTLVASFLVQTHVGYAPLVLAIALFVAVVLWLDRRRGALPDAPWARIVAWSAAAGVVAWLPAVVEQLTSDPGNLRRIATYVRDGGRSGELVGLSDGAGLLAAEYRLWPPWLGGDERVEAVTGAAEPASVAWLVVPVALLALGCWAARRSGSRDDGRFVALLGVVTLASVVALARVEPPAQAYLFLWRALVAALLVLAVGRAVVRWLRVDASGAGRVAVGVVLGGALLAGGTGLAWDVADGPTRADELRTDAAEEVVAQLRRRDRSGDPVLVRIAGAPVVGLVGPIVNELDRDGAPVRVDPDAGFQYGDGRTAAPDEVREVWLVAEQGQYGDALAAAPGARVIARSTPLSRAEERELARRQRELVATLVAEGREDLIQFVGGGVFDAALAEVPGVDAADVERITELNDDVRRRAACRCLVVAFEPDAVPVVQGQPTSV